MVARSLQIQVLTCKSKTVLETRVRTRSFMKIICFASINKDFPRSFTEMSTNYSHCRNIVSGISWNVKHRKFVFDLYMHCHALEINTESNSLRKFSSPSKDIIAKPTWEQKEPNLLLCISIFGPYQRPNKSMSFHE